MEVPLPAGDGDGADGGCEDSAASDESGDAAPDDDVRAAIKKRMAKVRWDVVHEDARKMREEDRKAARKKRRRRSS